MIANYGIAFNGKYKITMTVDVQIIRTSELCFFYVTINTVYKLSSQLNYAFDMSMAEMYEQSI